MEKRGYRDQLNELNDKYPGSALTITEAATELRMGVSTLRRRLNSKYPPFPIVKNLGRVYVAKTVLARVLVGGEY